MTKSPTATPVSRGSFAFFRSFGNTDPTKQPNQVDHLGKHSWQGGFAKGRFRQPLGGTCLEPQLLNLKRLATRIFGGSAKSWGTPPLAACNLGRGKNASHFISR